MPEKMWRFGPHHSWRDEDVAERGKIIEGLTELSDEALESMPMRHLKLRLRETVEWRNSLTALMSNPSDAHAGDGKMYRLLQALIPRLEKAIATKREKHWWRRLLRFASDWRTIASAVTGTAAIIGWMRLQGRC